MFHQDGLLFLIFVANGVGLFLDVLFGRLESAAADSRADESFWLSFALWLDFGLEVERVTDEAILAGCKIFDASVARVAAAVEHGNGALHEMQVGGVFEANAVQGMFGLDVLVVNREFGSFNFFSDDRQHRGFLALNGNGHLERILEEFSRYAAFSGSRGVEGAAPETEALGRHVFCKYAPAHRKTLRWY